MPSSNCYFISVNPVWYDKSILIISYNIFHLYRFFDIKSYIFRWLNINKRSNIKYENNKLIRCK